MKTKQLSDDPKNPEPQPPANIVVFSAADQVLAPLLYLVVETLPRPSAHVCLHCQGLLRPPAFHAAALCVRRTSAFLATAFCTRLPSMTRPSTYIGLSRLSLLCASAFQATAFCFLGPPFLALPYLLQSTMRCLEQS